MWIHQSSFRYPEAPGYPICIDFFSLKVAKQIFCLTLAIKQITFTLAIEAGVIPIV